MAAKQKLPKAAGFTIIEVLIVLAIAGIILLIVFEAVPVLERNARNSQRKQDVSAILQAVSHWELNNSGDIPGTSDNFLQFTNLSFYDPTQITIHPQVTTGGIGQEADQPPLSGAAAADHVDIYNYEKCSSTTIGAAVIDGAGYNDIVALYALESGNSAQPSPQCLQL